MSLQQYLYLFHPHRRETGLLVITLLLMQAFEKLQSDFNLRRIERCVRLDFAFEHGRGAGMTILGLNELEQTLRTCFRSAFQSRRAAYEEEVFVHYSTLRHLCANSWLIFI